MHYLHSGSVLKKRQLQNLIAMTPMQVSFILAFGLFFASTGKALKCNYCESDVSFESCDKYMKHVECAEEFGLNRCMRTHTKASRTTVEKYERRCSSADECDKPLCKAAGDDKCDVYCCTGDNCNKTSVTGVSGYTLFVCAVLVFLIKKMD